MNKIDCPHFNNIGNVCSRVDNMARCDEYSECEFKYIDELKEENTRLKEKLERIKEFCNYCTNVEHSGCALCKYDCEEPTAFILSIIEGAEE